MQVPTNSQELCETFVCVAQRPMAYRKLRLCCSKPNCYDIVTFLIGSIMGPLDSVRYGQYHLGVGLMRFAWNPGTISTWNLTGWKWIKDRSSSVEKPIMKMPNGRPFFGQSRKFVEFDDTKKAHMARTRLAAMANGKLTWEEAAVKGKLNPKFLKLD